VAEYLGKGLLQVFQIIERFIAGVWHVTLFGETPDSIFALKQTILPEDLIFLSFPE
jgi:hypothetical protein